MKAKKQSMLATLMLILFATVTLQSCHEKPKAIDPLQLEGYWILKSLNGQDAKNLFEGSFPTLQFDFDNMTIFGNGGCNNYNGAFTYNDAVFNAPNIAGTRMLCMHKNDEGLFWVELARPSTLSIENGLLTFRADGKDITIQFEKGEAPKTFNERLVGTWNLKNMDEKPATDFFKGEDATIPTLTFDLNENRISGNSGCNNFFSRFKIENGLLIVSPMGSTMKACPNMEGEAEYLKNLADTSGINLIDDNNLQIIKKGNIVLEYEK